MLIKPGIDASGYRTAVKDYTEPTVVEELAANSYDADATTCVILLDTNKGILHVYDDGIGFSQDAIERVAILGAGTKQTSVPFSKGKRHYLGSYGYGLRSSLNIANKLTLVTTSEDGCFNGVIDWTRLDEALNPDFKGFEFRHESKATKPTGTHIALVLKNPTAKDQLQEYGDHLANLPTDNAGFLCYFGVLSEIPQSAASGLANFKRLQAIARSLEKKKILALAETSRQADLDTCEVQEVSDKDDSKVKAKFFFAGINQGKVRQLKRGLRGIYVRVHGRLLKQSFTDSKFTYNISRWKKFESGLRVELTVDWLRDQISLSREGVRFANTKLEEEFKSVLVRLVSRFIQPQLKKLQQKAAKEITKKVQQRLELANKRVKRHKSILVPGLSNGFPFRPESDGEMALVLAQQQVLKAVGPSLCLIDYNDQAGFDCVLYDKTRRELINVELEPSLMEWLGHKESNGIEMIVTWTLGRWKIGAKKKGSCGVFKLVNDVSKKPGRYRLLEYPSAKSRNPKKDYTVIALEEVLG